MRTYIEKTLGGYTFIEIEENGIISCIPTDPANSGYQRYLRWLENPNADEFQPPLS